MKWQQHIVQDPEVLYEKPVIKKTRIPVDLILEKLAAGDTVDDLLQAYPNITREDIAACLLFAAEVVMPGFLLLHAGKELLSVKYCLNVWGTSGQLRQRKDVQ
jgi:uncharacterized protein (DUF433 family)